MANTGGMASYLVPLKVKYRLGIGYPFPLRYKCPKCYGKNQWKIGGKKAGLSRTHMDLLKHIRIHHGSCETRFFCRKCRGTWNTIKELKKHYGLVHRSPNGDPLTPTEMTLREEEVDTEVQIDNRYDDEMNRSEYSGLRNANVNISGISELPNTPTYGNILGVMKDIDRRIKGNDCDSDIIKTKIGTRASLGGGTTINEAFRKVIPANHSTPREGDIVTTAVIHRPPNEFPWTSAWRPVLSIADSESEIVNTSVSGESSEILYRKNGVNKRDKIKNNSRTVCDTSVFKRFMINKGISSYNRKERVISVGTDPGEEILMDTDFINEHLHLNNDVDVPETVNHENYNESNEQDIDDNLDINDGIDDIMSNLVYEVGDEIDNLSPSAFNRVTPALTPSPGLSDGCSSSRNKLPHGVALWTVNSISSKEGSNTRIGEDESCNMVIPGDSEIFSNIPGNDGLPGNVQVNIPLDSNVAMGEGARLDFNYTRIKLLEIVSASFQNLIIK